MPPLLLPKCWDQIGLFFEFGIMETKKGETFQVMMFFEWKVASWKWYVIYLSCVFHVPLCFDPATDIDGENPKKL